MDRKKEFNVLYYPFCKCYDETLLKRMLLFYDKIYFMDPFNVEEREHLIRTSHYFYGIPNNKLHNWETINREIYYLLEKKGLVVNIDIYDLLNKYNRQIAENVFEDISDNSFCQISQEHDVSRIWHILKRRMPDTLLKKLNEIDWNTFRFQVDYHEFREYLERLEHFRDRAVDFNAYNSRFWKERDNLLHRNELRGIKGPFGRYNFDSSYQIDRTTDVYIKTSNVPKYEAKDNCNKTLPLDKGYLLPYTIGASISISQAMLVAALYNLSLFTNSEIMNRLLVRKFQIAFEKINRSMKFKEYTELKKKMEQKEIFIQTIDSMIPDVYFNKLDFLDIIKLRNACEKPLKKFRYFLRAFSDIRSNPWESEYWDEVLNTAEKVSFESKALQDKICETYKNLFRNSIKLIAGAGLGIAVMPQNLTVGAALALLASKEPLDAIWKTWKNRAELNNHSLIYLLKIQKSLE